VKWLEMREDPDVRFAAKVAPWVIGVLCVALLLGFAWSS
jgi:hypothetical protein